MTFGDPVDSSGARGLIEQALDAGAVMIDTANVYSSGQSETILGEVLPGIRDRVVLATKVGVPTSVEDTAPLAGERIRSECEGSLRRLGTDHIDLYYLHKPDRATPFEESLAAVAALIAQGKVRAWGVSNFAAWQIAELRHVAEGLGMPAPAVAQQQYNLLSRRLEDEYAEFARAAGVGTVVYNPLAGGMLTGKHLGTTAPVEGRFSSSEYRGRYWNPQMHAAVDRLSALAQDRHLTLVQLALRWLLAGDIATSVLLGASRPEHLAENLAAVSEEALDAQALEACDEVWAGLRGVAPAYNR
jgi:aryl-alcohol dehydrogenase-like predicted oxidoreductase